jgi:CDP-4-dehydro-6-deoxyglucose reductase
MKAVLRAWRHLAPEVRHFNFEADGIAELPFVPGQFVSLSHPINGRIITRAYSIASAPDGNRFSLCLNRVQDGFLSPHLFAMKEGDAVAMQGPLGTFTIRSPARDVIMVATGTGIAPFRAMLEHRGRAGVTGNCILVFGVRYEENILYRQELEQWSDFRPTLSRPGPAWTGRRGHVQEHVLEALGNRRDVDIYICGLKLMVDDMRARLKALGLDRRQIICEKYD